MSKPRPPSRGDPTISSAASPAVRIGGDGGGGGGGGGGCGANAPQAGRPRAPGVSAANHKPATTPRVWASLQRCENECARSGSGGGGGGGGGGSRPVTPGLALAFGLTDTDTDTDTDSSFGPFSAGGGVVRGGGAAAAAARTGDVPRSPATAPAASMRQITSDRLVIGRSSTCDFQVRARILLHEQHLVKMKQERKRRELRSSIHVRSRGVAVYLCCG